MIIWALTDDRAGNNSQTIGLAQSLSQNYQIKQISYNKIANLPNFLTLSYLAGINSDLKKALISAKSPDIIIATGRKLARIAIFLKKYHKNSFLIQIMNPNLNFNQFDAVILPHHDKNHPYKNIIRSFGSLTKINHNKLKLEKKKFDNILNNITKPKIALLIGGSSKKKKFTHNNAQNLREICNNIANNMGANLLILDSRRTDKFIIPEFENNLNCNYQIFRYNKTPNPYLAILEDADYIIATGDSISMCSEISSLNKAIYIYAEESFCSKKHLKFHQNLFKNNYAKRLDNSITILENYPRNILDETNRISKIIHRNISKN
ncbi:mitochondrial fission ELM1 family protein [Rickettsiales bacterium]|nr:mitochondrial fission ELM1 family protein [Rickettsiales bacterium]MDB2550367.1 mitochondrial fission ELM1 family protein [Rickettsiales bacterium]